MGDCPVGAYADHRARSRNDTGLQIKPRTLALGGWRSILLRSLSGCLLLCLIRLRRRGQDSRQESLRILWAWDRDAGSTAIGPEAAGSDEATLPPRSPFTLPEFPPRST